MLGARGDQLAKRGEADVTNNSGFLPKAKVAFMWVDLGRRRNTS